MELSINRKKIGPIHPTYFIADIAANHDGNLLRAKELIYLAADAGADAAKFQHFTAQTIVSDYGFKNLGGQQSHQAKWKKSVFQVYDEASMNVEWTPALAETCEKAGIEFFTSPYSFGLIDAVDPYVPAYKVGSGDITWLEIISYMAKKNKPMLLATGAATLDETMAAVETILRSNLQLVLMQCNTNYTASLENFKYINLNVLRVFHTMYPELILGLSDHTPGHTTVLGAVALGARVIEKHFTDDIQRQGPDHGFSMDPKTWKAMVQNTRELEAALGSGLKKVEENEKQTVILQRRSIRAKATLVKGTKIETANVEVLRPCPADGIPPYKLDAIIGKILQRDITAGEHLRWIDLN
jgi:sialic acid synthase SpsE